MASEHSNRGAKRAREARAAIGVDPAAALPCLLTLVEEDFGYPVVLASLGDVAGACWRDGDSAVLWVNGAESRPRQRFTLAHELGHARLRHDGHVQQDTFETFSGRTTIPREVEANAFAAEFLVPKVAVCDAFGREPGLDELVTFAAGFGVSAIMALIRLVTCDVVGAKREKKLRAEIDAEHHVDAFTRLGLEDIEDRLAGAEHLPYLSPALADSALAAALAGDAPVVAAAQAADVAPEHLGPALESLVRP